MHIHLKIFHIIYIHIHIYQFLLSRDFFWYSISNVLKIMSKKSETFTGKFDQKRTLMCKFILTGKWQKFLVHSIKLYN